MLEKSLCGSVLAQTEQTLKHESCVLAERTKPSEDTVLVHPTCTGSPPTSLAKPSELG